jgi:hypothetical protein
LAGLREEAVEQFKGKLGQRIAQGFMQDGLTKTVRLLPPSLPEHLAERTPGLVNIPTTREYRGLYLHPQGMLAGKRREVDSRGHRAEKTASVAGVDLNTLHHPVAIVKAHVNMGHARLPERGGQYGGALQRTVMGQKLDAGRGGVGCSARQDPALHGVCQDAAAIPPF